MQKKHLQFPRGSYVRCHYKSAWIGKVITGNEVGWVDIDGYLGNYHPYEQGAVWKPGGGCMVVHGTRTRYFHVPEGCHLIRRICDAYGNPYRKEMLCVRSTWWLTPYDAKTSAYPIVRNYAMYD